MVLASHPKSNRREPLHEVQPTPMKPPVPDCRIWIEIDDFMRMFDWSLTPTGIGRVQMELIPALLDRHGDRIRLFRLGHSASDVRTVTHREVRALVARMRALRGDTPAKRARIRVAQALRAARRTVGRWASAAAPGGHARQFATDIRPGDLVVNFGASWENPHYAAALGALKQQHGFRFVLFVHDILPVSHPGLVSPVHAPNFARWLTAMMPLCDAILTPSRATQVILEDWLAEHRMAIPAIRPVRYGDGLVAPRRDAGIAPVCEAPYVLFVSTIEIRKNHLALVRIWKRLIEAHGRDTVPALVFAGKLGWQIAELLRELEATGRLDGKIRVVENLSDAQIQAAYDACLFTVFPSLCEGWGLPVSESLAHGKYCIASDATSIPEAGGRFCDYFPATDEDEAYRLIERALFEPEFIEKREAVIHREFAPVPWTQTADQIVAFFGELDGKPAKASLQAAQ